MLEISSLGFTHGNFISEHLTQAWEQVSNQVRWLLLSKRKHFSNIQEILSSEWQEEIK
jgi:hypothetical protein